MVPDERGPDNCPESTEGHSLNDPMKDGAHAGTLALIEMFLNQTNPDGGEGPCDVKPTEETVDNDGNMKTNVPPGLALHEEGLRELLGRHIATMRENNGTLSAQGEVHAGVTLPPEHQSNAWQHGSSSLPSSSFSLAPPPSATPLPPPFSAGLPMPHEVNQWQHTQQFQVDYQQNANMPPQAQAVAFMQVLLENMNMYQDVMGCIHRVVAELKQVIPRLGPSMELLVPGLQGSHSVSLAQLADISREPSRLWWMGKLLDMDELATLLQKSSNAQSYPWGDGKRREHNHFVEGNGYSHTLQKNKRARKSGMSNKHKGRSCAHCKTETTPFWRRDQNTDQYLCNACGLYYAKNNAPRPLNLTKQKSIDAPNNTYGVELHSVE